MPRPLNEYGVRDWLRLRPLSHALKSARYQWVTARYVAKPARIGDMAALRRRIAGQRVMVTIAFNDAEILERQLRHIALFVPGPLHIVVDNSRDEAKADLIAAACARAGAPYIRLPVNPWGPNSPSRSHGLSLDWTWRNLILPGRPEAFGFLDHDLIPVAPDDPFAPLATQPVHGDKRWAGERWFLWAGYCFFRTDFMASKTVDFSQDWFIGLDSGGGNWRTIYRHLDPKSLIERPLEEFAISEDIPLKMSYFERRQHWLHEVGFGGRPELRDAKRAVFLGMLDEAAARHEAASGQGLRA